MKKASPGFTLVELLSSLAGAAMVLAAAVSLMLLGLRMENRAALIANQQQTARIVLTMTEKLAADGEIKSISRSDGDWALHGGDGGILLRYAAAEGGLYIGDAVLMSGLKSANVELNGDETLLTLSLETEYDTYTVSVYCRNDITENQ